MSWEKIQKSTKFSFLIEKEIRKVDKDGNDDFTTISCKAKYY